MSKPNKVFSKKRTKFDLIAWYDVRNSTEADEKIKELKESKLYDLVKMARYKVGARPNKYNGFKQAYSYIVRAYKLKKVNHP